MAGPIRRVRLYSRAQAACEAAGVVFSRYPAPDAPGRAWLDMVPARRGWCLVQAGTPEPLSGPRGLKPHAMAAFLETMAARKAVA